MVNNIFMWVAVFDAGLVLLAGVAAAFMFLLGKDMRGWWERIFPATAMLVGTTIAAGVIMAAARWMFGG